MLTKSKLLAGVAAAAALMGSTAVLAGELDAKGSVYGDLRYALDFSDSNAQDNGLGATAQDTDLRDNNSYAGIKASVGEGELKAFAVYNVNLANDVSAETTREGYFGVITGFGTITAGDQFTAYMMSAHNQDPFRNTSLASTNGAVPDLASALGSYGQSVLTAELLGGGLQANQVTYTSPSFAGVTVNAAWFIDEQADGTTGAQQESHDYGLGAAFNMGPINAGVQYLQINDEVGTGTLAALNGTGDGSATRVHASFAQPRFGVGVSLERLDEQGLGVLDQEYAFLSAWFGVTGNTRLAALAGMTNETGFEGTGVSLGVFHTVFENFTVWAGGSQHDRKVDTVNSGFAQVNSNDTYVVALGASYKFDLGFSTK